MKNKNMAVQWEICEDIQVKMMPMGSKFYSYIIIEAPILDSTIQRILDSKLGELGIFGNLGYITIESKKNVKKLGSKNYCSTSHATDHKLYGHSMCELMQVLSMIKTGLLREQSDGKRK